MKTDYVRSVTEDHGTGLKEHALYDNRAYHTDEVPHYLAARRSNIVHSGEATVGNLRKHLAAALEALTGLDESKPVPLSKVSRAVDAYEALDNIEYFLPKVEAWCVYRTPNENGDWARIYCGALTEAQAGRLLKMVAAYEQKKERAHPWWEKESERLAVKKMPCAIADLVHPDMPDDQFTRSWS